MRNRLESQTFYRSESGRNRLESITQQEISPTLLEITTIYEKVKKGRDNEIYRLLKFGIPPQPEYQLFQSPHGGGGGQGGGGGGGGNSEDETIPLVPSFPSNLSENQAVRFLDFNKYNGLPIRKYLYFSSATNTIQSDTLEGLSPNYTQLLKSEFYWLNITDPNESDLAILFNSFNVHDFTISDIRETNTEEKIEFYQHYTFMSTRLLREVKIKHAVPSGNNSDNGDSCESVGEDDDDYDEYNDNDIEIGRRRRRTRGRTTTETSGASNNYSVNTSEEKSNVNNTNNINNSSSHSHNTKSKPVDMDFNILLFKNFVITMHDKKWSSINDILGFVNLICNETILTPDWVLYSIFIELAQDAQYLLAGIEPKLNELRVGSTSNIKEMSRVLHENYEMEFQLYAIQRFLKPKVNILRTLKVKCGRRFGKILLKLLNEIRDDFVEMNNDLRNLNHILERSQDTFLALVSVEKSREANEMSLVMKRISQIALIFLPIQAISGFFGMNVFVPFQDDSTDNKNVLYFWLIVLFSGIVAICMYLSRSFLLKKLNWGKNKSSSSSDTNNTCSNCCNTNKRKRWNLCCNRKRNTPDRSGRRVLNNTSTNNTPTHTPTPTPINNEQINVIIRSNNDPTTTTLPSIIPPSTITIPRM